VASGSRNAPFILEKVELSDLLDASVSGRDIERSKPDPQVFLLAAEQLGVPPEQCLVVEDAPSGVEAGKRAGMKVLGVSGRETLQQADRSVAALSEITAEEMLDMG
jgi:beta-phosphoglucomutase